MAKENISQVDEKCCLDDAKPMEIIDETSVQEDDVLLPPAAESNGDVIKPEINHVNLRQCLTEAFTKRRPVKAQIQPRYRGNQVSSTHDLCKYGKRREDDLVTKPWKLVKKKNVDCGDLKKDETLDVIRIAKRQQDKSLQVAKRQAASEIVKCWDGLRVKRSETKSSTPSVSSVVSKVKKTNLDVKKVSRMSENKSSKEDLLKNLKNKEKMKIDEPVRCEDVKEKTLYVIEEKKKIKSIKSVKSEIQKSSEKNILRGSGNKSLKLLPSLSPSSEEVKESQVTRSDPRPIRQTTSMSKTGLSEKKEIGSATLVTNSKTESKIRPKRIGLNVTPPHGPPRRQLSFKRGKVLEPKPEDLTPTLVKFKKRVDQEPKPKDLTLTLIKFRKRVVQEPKPEDLTPTLIKFKKRVVQEQKPEDLTPTLIKFKKRVVQEPKHEDLSPTLIKLKKRVVQEPKLRSDVSKKKKNLKDKREGVRKMNNTNGEGKREKVVLRHRKVEEKKKLQTLYNNVIEETVNKLAELKKSKVKALVGAFETVISLQNDKTKTSQKKKIQRKSTLSQVVES